MRLYAGPSTHFIRDTAHNQIAEKLKSAFFAYYRFNPSPGEVNAWRNSLRATAQIFEEADLKDHGVLLEYQLPLTSKRLDCMVCGRDGQDRENAVILELKQWDKAEQAVGEKRVLTWVGGAEREVLHPSAQVGQYQMYLEDAHTAFYEGDSPVRLSSCSYLHNYFPDPQDVLFAEAFRPLLERYPVFTGDDVGTLKDFLVTRLDAGQGMDVLRRVEESRYRPSKKLMEHVAGVIKGKGEFVLLDEQLLVYEKVFQWAREGFHDRRKSVLIVKGGPGTGKSVIAINLMADLLRQGYNAHYATGSKAFTETLRKIIGMRGSVQFKYFNSYRNAAPNEIDVLLCDESHRIRRQSWSRFTPKAKRSTDAQIDELLRVGKVCVFLIDDRQVVRPDEVGSVALIRKHAERAGAQIVDYELEAQFRCAGSDAFVNWVSNTLGVERTANAIWEGDESFEFEIVSSPGELDSLIREKGSQGFSARVTAGFCWPWSKPRRDGTLVDDVVIGEWKRPWNARPEAGRLAPGIPKAPLWAYEAAGLDQVGCIYTAQGFEFDYAGVIWGLDLVYDFELHRWVGQRDQSCDTTVKRSKEAFVGLVKNAYRVLLSRGLKGCYVHFMDRDTERFVRSRMDLARG
jgi:uncharacterized protein